MGLSLLDIRQCPKLTLYVISRKMYDPNSRNGERHMVSYHHVSIIIDGRTDRQTDREMDESDFIRRCLTDFECPTLVPESIFLIKLLAKSCNFIKKEILALVFFCDFFNNTFFTEQLWWLLLNLLSCSRIQTFYFPEKGFALSLQNYFLKVSSGI